MSKPRDRGRSFFEAARYRACASRTAPTAFNRRLPELFALEFGNQEHCSDHIEDNDHRPDLERNEDGLTADPVSELAEDPDAKSHAQNRNRSPRGGPSEAEAVARL